MNSLVNYGSDDDLDDSSDERSTTATYGSGKSGARKPQMDANYDEVQMSLSEDSGEDSRPSRDTSVASGSKEDYGYRDRGDRERYASRDRDDERYRSDRDRKTDREDRDRRHDREDRDKYRDTDEQRSRDNDRNREHYRSDRDEEKSRDRRDDRRGKSKERNSGREDRYRDRKERDRRRSRSRDRRSRSPRDRRSRSRSRDRRSRSRSPRRDDRFRGDRGGRPPYKRFERNRMDQPRTAATAKPMPQETNQEGPQDRFFMPGITGKYREQIEKRKLLWQKKDAEKPEASVQMASVATPKATKVWESTTFAQDTDGKVANKFKRLMGIRKVSDDKQPATEVLKKQEEMFSSMEQQYEVARTATHTMRGVGLGFGSFQR